MGPPPQPLSSSSMPNFLFSAADEWFLNSSDRDTQILTQALSMCSRGGPAPASSSSSSHFHSPASYSSANPIYETFSRCLDGKPLQSQSFEALRALQKQQQLNQLQQQKASAMLSTVPGHGDGFAYLEQVSQQKESSLSNNSSESSLPLSASVEAPASPFSMNALSPNSAMSTIATENFLAQPKSKNPQHHDFSDGHFARESSRSSKATSIALSSQTSLGAGGCKVSKRKNRASSKAPIAVLSADMSNFRAMVQQLTGISSSSCMQTLTHGGIPFLKPQPIGNPFTNTLNLPTLDTSACFLGPKNPEGFALPQRPYRTSKNSPANLSAYAGRVDGCNGYNAQSLQQHAVQSMVFNGQNSSSMVPMTDCQDLADSLKVRGGLSSLLEGGQISMKQSVVAATPTLLDSLLAEGPSAPNLPMSAADSWFSFLEGALTSQASSMETARMA